MYEGSSLLLQSHLSKDETLLWAGQPCQGLFLTPSDAFLIPFSLLWGGFAIFWEASVIAAGAPFFFKLWGVPFVLVGLYMIAGRFFFDARQRASTQYGVTSERILIITSGRFTKIKSLALQTLAEISLHLKPDGSGTIIFGSVNPFNPWKRYEFVFMAGSGVGSSPKIRGNR